MVSNFCNDFGFHDQCNPTTNYNTIASYRLNLCLFGLKLFHITFFCEINFQTKSNDCRRCRLNIEHCIHRAIINFFMITTVVKHKNDKFSRKKWTQGKKQSKQTLSGLIGTLVLAMESTIQSNTISSKASKRMNDIPYSSLLTPHHNGIVRFKWIIFHFHSQS